MYLLHSKTTYEAKISLGTSIRIRNWPNAAPSPTPSAHSKTTYEAKISLGTSKRIRNIAYR